MENQYLLDTNTNPLAYSQYNNKRASFNCAYEQATSNGNSNRIPNILVVVQ